MRTSSLLAQLKGDTSWMHHLTDAAIAQLESAVAHVKAKGLNFPHFVKDDFPLADDVLDLKLHSEELENGRGFLVLRGLPVERYIEEDIHIMYYGIGLHMGIPVRQNPRGDLLGLVMNVGDATQKTTRVYETNLYLPYHSDPSDVVGLLCIRKAKQGGLSSLVSVAAIYNEILQNHPEYLRQYIELGHEVRHLPLSKVEIEALDLFDEIMHREEFRLNMMLEPGDLQFANNDAVLHSRNEFEDHEVHELHRKRLRLWVKLPNARELAPEFPGRNGFPELLTTP